MQDVFDRMTPLQWAMVAGGALALLYIWRSGSVSQAAYNVGAGTVDAVGNVAAGAVGEVGTAVGLPTPAQTTVDPAVARWIMDAPDGGYLAASEWASAPALFKALGMDAGTGTPPPAGSPIAAAFPGGMSASAAPPSLPSGYVTTPAITDLQQQIFGP